MSTLLATVVLGASSITTLAAKKGEAKSKATVDFKLGSQSAKPFDPTDPTVPPKEVNPGAPGEGEGTDGYLRFDRVPNFKFETIEIGSEKQTGKVYQEKYVYKGTTEEFYAAPTLEISDVRGTGAGWNAFASIDDTLRGPSEIKKFTLSLNNAVVSSYSGVTTKAPTFHSVDLNKDAQKILSAEKNTGTASWGISFYDDSVSGSVGTDGKPAKNTTGTPLTTDAVTLKIAQGEPMNPGATYTTSITWYLNNDPASTTPEN